MILRLGLIALLLTTSAFAQNQPSTTPPGSTAILISVSSAQLIGDLTYRSFINTLSWWATTRRKPLIFGEGIFTFAVSNATLTGIFDMGNGYVLDLKGVVHPADSHAPLTVRALRILRRGITFGERPDLAPGSTLPPPETGAGLLFMCYAQRLLQFVIQRDGADSNDFVKTGVGPDATLGNRSTACCRQVVRDGELRHNARRRIFLRTRSFWRHCDLNAGFSSELTIETRLQ